jgi:nitroreductase
MRKSGGIDMDVAEAIKTRKSIRAFKPDPVPLEVIREIIEQAQRAPSWANTQPWEFAVVTGEPLKAIQKGFMERGMQDPQSEVARPFEFPEPYMERIRALAPKDRSQMTEEEMKERMLINFRHYGATTCIYLLVDRSIIYQEKGVNVWSMYDSGSAVQNIMLLVVSKGLGTIAQAQAVVYPDIIRKHVAIPAIKLIALGIAIGYPDISDASHQMRTAREPLDEIASFYGF